MVWCCVLLLLAAPLAAVRPSAPVGAVRTVPIRAQGFARLPERQQKFVYWLVRAAVAVDPIAYAQNSPNGKSEKQLLEGIASRNWMLPPGRRRRFMVYMRQFWADHGNHDPRTGAPLPVPFRLPQLKADAGLALRAGAWHGSRATMLALLHQASGPLLHPRPARTGQAPASPLAFGPERSHVLSALEHARSYAAPGFERTQVKGLIRYWRLGRAADWRRFVVAAAADRPPVWFAGGFFAARRRAAGFVCIGARLVSSGRIRCAAVVETGALAGTAAGVRLGPTQVQFWNAGAALRAAPPPAHGIAAIVSPWLRLQREAVTIQSAGGLAAQRLRWALVNETYLPEPRRP